MIKLIYHDMRYHDNYRLTLPAVGSCQLLPVLSIQVEFVLVSCGGWGG